VPTLIPLTKSTCAQALASCRCAASRSTVNDLKAIAEVVAIMLAVMIVSFWVLAGIYFVSVKVLGQ
jgi:hypothetical protein